MPARALFKLLIFQPAAESRSRYRWLIGMILLIPNLLFFGVHYAARCLPLEPIKERITLALARGDIQTDPHTFIYLDSARGVEPWGDANTLRMALYRGPSRWRDALAPRLLDSADGTKPHPVRQLNATILGAGAFNPESGYYHRYWHGNVAITSFLLSIFDVRQARLFLMNTSYFLFMLIPVLACGYSWRLGIPIAVVCGFGTCFSGLPYHGQTFAYAPAFIWSQMVIFPVLWLRRTAGSAANAVPLGLILGAITAFLEPMSGAAVLSASFFFLTLYFSMPDSQRDRNALQMAGTAVAALLLGVLFSVVFKQVTAAVFFGWKETFSIFSSKLLWRMGLTPEPISYWNLVSTLNANLVYLTFGSPVLAKVLAWSSGLALLGGCTLCVRDVLRNKFHKCRFDYMAVLGTIVLCLGWYVAFPSHSIIHAWITVRLLYVPFALAWVLLWLAARAHFMRRAGTNEETAADIVAV